MSVDHWAILRGRTNLRIPHFAAIVMALSGLLATPTAAWSAELPGDYFKLMAAGLTTIKPEPELRNAPSYMFAAAVL